MSIWKVLINVGLLIRLGKVLPQLVESAIHDHKMPDCSQSVEALGILKEIFDKEIFPLGDVNKNLSDTVSQVVGEMQCKS